MACAKKWETKLLMCDGWFYACLSDILAIVDISKGHYAYVAKSSNLNLT